MGWFALRKGFSLIELFLIVAIIAVLTAIAIPNFVDSQYRAKLSRGRAELRTAAVAVEAYKIDNLQYPYDGYFVSGPPTNYNFWYLPYTLSTPVAYLRTSIIQDPYRESVTIPVGGSQTNNIRYTNVDSTWGTAFSDLSGHISPSAFYGEVLKEFGRYKISLSGPDRTYGPYGFEGISTYPSSNLQMPYDPTNGLYSLGDLLRSQNSEVGYVNITGP